MATNLAHGALVAWQVPAEKLDAAFDYMFQQDPFSGHVVMRSTDAATAGSNYRLWTTLKVPQGFSMRKHCRVPGATRPARNTSASCPPSGSSRWASATSAGAAWSRAPRPTRRPKCMDVAVVELSEVEWRVLTALKREFDAARKSAETSGARARRGGRARCEIFFEVGRRL